MGSWRRTGKPLRSEIFSAPLFFGVFSPFFASTILGFHFRRGVEFRRTEGQGAGKWRSAEASLPPSFFFFFWPLKQQLCSLIHFFGVARPCFTGPIL
ncbi:hypothetical protein OROMI_021074 [Orobanche minor]